ncbi:MAG: class I SAM-dependent methyltransferase [Actinomycetota bacterium]|nr:class I SAM-dependent methyltransferase [Actinomycetota bacterium]
MEVTRINRPEFDADTEGRMRTLTFAWLLAEVVPKGERLLDLGAGACIFAQRAVNAGYSVTAVDARAVRRPEELDERINFVEADVRDFEPAEEPDVVAVLGLLYHLPLNEQSDLLERFRDRTVILDTQIHDPHLVTDAAAEWATEFVSTDDGYEGVVFPETDNPMASVGNPESFWHTEDSLFRLVKDCGYENATAIEPVYVSKYGARKFYVLS